MRLSSAATFLVAVAATGVSATPMPVPNFGDTTTFNTRKGQKTVTNLGLGFTAVTNEKKNGQTSTKIINKNNYYPPTYFGRSRSAPNIIYPPDYFEPSPNVYFQQQPPPPNVIIQPQQPQPRMRRPSSVPSTDCSGRPSPAMSRARIT